MSRAVAITETTTLESLNDHFKRKDVALCDVLFRVERSGGGHPLAPYSDRVVAYVRAPRFRA